MRAREPSGSRKRAGSLSSVEAGASHLPNPLSGAGRSVEQAVLHTQRVRRIPSRSVSSSLRGWSSLLLPASIFFSPVLLPTTWNRDWGSRGQLAGVSWVRVTGPRSVAQSIVSATLPPALCPGRLSNLFSGSGPDAAVRPIPGVETKGRNGETAASGRASESQGTAWPTRNSEGGA